MAHLDGQVDVAHNLVHDSLTALPGHTDFLEFATEIGAPLPAQAQRIATERVRWETNTR